MPKTGQNTPAETLPMLKIAEGLHQLAVNDLHVYTAQYDVFLFCNSMVLLNNVEFVFHKSPQNFCNIMSYPVIP